VIKKHQYSIKMAKNEIIITRLSFFLSIIIITVLFLRYPKLSGSQFDIEEYTYKDIDQIDIPLTHQKLENLPRPTRPSIPIAAETEDISDDLTLEEFSFEEYDLLDAPPPMPKACDAIRKTRFIPAKQREIPVGVWISVPVRFKLNK